MADAASDEIPAAKLATWPRNMITLLSEQNRPCAEIEEAFGCPRRWPACARCDIANCPKSAGIRHWRPSCRQITMRALRAHSRAYRAASVIRSPGGSEGTSAGVDPKPLRD